MESGSPISGRTISARASCTAVVVNLRRAYEENGNDDGEAKVTALVSDTPGEELQAFFLCGSV